MRLQLIFFKKYFIASEKGNISIEKYFSERNNKYNDRTSISPLFTTASLPIYFATWLAGFIEAEGSFSYRQSGQMSFSIAQNHDLYLLEGIRDFYEVNHLIIQTKRGKVSGIQLYELSIASRAGVSKVVDHCLPLLQGYKYVQLEKFPTMRKRDLVCVMLSDHCERYE